MRGERSSRPRAAVCETRPLRREPDGSFQNTLIAVYFDLNGRELWYGSYAGKPQLTRTDWSAARSTEVALPPLSRDAVAYIAQNPAERQEYAIATFQRSVFISKDGGRSWRQVADKGRGS